ncbi:MAG: glycosyltransferase family 61 protein, partial [Gluconacetobacter diazotrophicus]|nr:glycosyltransferase family 61 protein [Gluconacetobacter diazotrophicus]
MQEFIGFDANAMAYNRQYEISAEPPELVTVADALLCGMRPTVDGNFLEQLAGGVFDRDGRPVGAGLQPRSDGREAVLAEQSGPPPEGCGRIAAAVFGGIAFDHFGHFLLEATARLWALPEHRTLPWVFLSDGRSGLRDYQKGFLALLGLKEEQILTVSDRLVVDRLVVPAPAFTYHHRATHAYRDTFRRAVLPGRARRGRRVFLSRSQTRLALTVGERELEDVLRADGWDVVIPERLPPAEQARLFRDDNLLLGLQGSAMHLGLFAPPGRRVVHLCRGQGYRGYYVLDDLTEADATYLQAMAEPPLRSKPITGPFLLDLDRTVGFLRERGLMSPAPVQGAALPAIDPREMMEEYVAWWHFTESQIRFHRHIADDGSAVAPDSALDSAMAALTIRPGNRDMLQHAAALTLKFGTAAEAEALLDRHAPWFGEEARAGDAPLLLFRSMIRDRLGDHAGALRAADAAAALAPEDAGIANQRATVLYRLERLDEAEAILAPLIDAGRATGSNRLLHSLVLDRMGRFDAALDAAAAAAEADRHDETICRHFAGMLRRAKREDAAAEAIAAFLERNTGSPALLLEMAELDRARGRKAAATARVALARTLAPEEPAVRAAVLADLEERGQFPNLDFLGRT